MIHRPAYETEKDREIELEIARQLSIAWRCDVVRQHKFAHLDFELRRSAATAAWAEFKRRHVTRDTYPNIFLSLQKVFVARRMHSETGKPCFFVVQFDDCLAYANMLPVRPIAWRGRADRNDPGDYEWVALVRQDEFKVI